MKTHPLVNILGQFVVSAIEGAAEAVIDEAQDKLEEINERMTTAKNKVRARRTNKSQRAEKVTVEVTSPRKNH